MTISIAIATYNGSLYLEEQLNSILMQKQSAHEIVVCDDGSTDATWSILSTYADKNPHIFKIFKNERQLGVIKNFEKAINLCSGDLIFLADQDDIWFDHKTQEISAYFKKHQQAEAVFHNLALLRNDTVLEKTLWDSLLFTSDIQTLSSDELVVHSLLVTNVLTGAAFAFRKTHVKFAPHPEILHDAQLLLHFSRRKSLKAYPSVLGYYRLHDGQEVSVNTADSSFLKYKFETVYKKENFGNLYNLYKNRLTALNTGNTDFPSFIYTEKVLKKWYRKQVNKHASRSKGLKKLLIKIKWLIK